MITLPNETWTSFVSEGDQHPTGAGESTDSIAFDCRLFLPLLGGAGVVENQQLEMKRSTDNALWNQ